MTTYVVQTDRLCSIYGMSYKVHSHTMHTYKYNYSYYIVQLHSKSRYYITYM